MNSLDDLKNQIIFFTVSDLCMKTGEILEKITLMVFGIIILFLLIFVFISSNSSSNPQFSMVVNNSGKNFTPTYDEKTVQENFGVGLYNKPVHDANFSMRYSKSLHENDSFDGYLFLSNQMKVKNEFLVFCLFDYAQVPFENENRNTQVTQVIQLEPFEERFFYFNLGNVSKGAHDFEIFTIMKPNEHSLDEKYRRSTDISYLGSKRINVIVGNSTMDDPVFTSYNTKNISSVCGSEYPVNNGILITEKPCSTELWMTKNVTDGSVFDYYVNAAADNKYPVSFGLVALLDYKQIPVRDDLSGKTLFGTLDTGEKVSFRTQVRIPSDKGIHELMVIWIPAPYKKLEHKRGISPEITEGIWSTPSTRVALIVQ